jgi:uncharacterized membrane protein
VSRDVTRTEFLGPIQVLVVAFPTALLHGKILPALDRLKHDGIVRVIDMLVLRKDSDGRILVATATDLDWEEVTSLGAYLGSLAGYAEHGAEGAERGALVGAAELADGHIFDDDDVFRLGRALGPDTTLGIVLIEHTWALDFLDAVADAEGADLLNRWVSPESVLSVDERIGL